MLTSVQMRSLVAELDQLAAATWHKIRVGPSRGLKFGEESLTDHNLFELDRMCAGVEICKFDHSEEALNGADFEWYVGGPRQGWIGMRFQAKKLEDGAYFGLGHRVGQDRQYDLLLRLAALDRMWPFYCFYNGWDGGWPNDVKNSDCPKGVTPTHVGQAKGCAHADLEDFGCSVAPAACVAGRHRSSHRRGRLELDDYLAHSRPWSHLFRGGKSSKAHPSEDIVSALSASLGAWAAQAVLSVGDVWPDAGDRRSAGAGIPEGGGLHGQLPPWLRTVRDGSGDAFRHGSGDQGGFRPRMAMVLDVEAG